ncbi:hypothetical protein AZE42_11986 [Rhizopogon vesiculosus]|uniref:Uncharacterized protein n=1 Tax=Rhizopogon vesiculosus TaxID=180088 RepID=A0A1J8Q4X5_9AGAM|nr:hypothetical protein AZE42_11986 [Rhizopogon vesiculosus]
MAVPCLYCHYEGLGVFSSPYDRIGRLYDRTVTRTVPSKILSALYVIGYSTGNTSLDSGITVHPHPMSVNGHVLPMPSIYYANAPSNKPVVRPRCYETHRKCTDFQPSGSPKWFLHCCQPNLPPAKGIIGLGDT